MNVKNPEFGHFRVFLGVCSYPKVLKDLFFNIIRMTDEKEANITNEKEDSLSEMIDEKKASLLSMTNQKGSGLFKKNVVALVVVVIVILLFNQWQIYSISSGFSSGIKKIDPSQVYDIKTTSQAIASLFPIEDIQTDQDAIDMMISQGTPEYWDAMGISFDDPVGSMELLAAGYNTVKEDIKQNNPELWERYLNLATKPVGISCEFCCGVGPVGINKKGDMTCGCKHNPAIQALTMLLMKDTNYDDAEILRETLKWKSLWFPRDMVNLALKASGGEIETELPGMVGGC